MQLFVSCSNDAKFAGKGSFKSEDFAKKIVPDEPAQPNPNPLPNEPLPPSKDEPDGSLSQNFTSTPALGLVDIAWVVDQSLSMSEEIANVRKNLLNFITAIDAKFDANHALIASQSKSDKIYSLALPIVDNKHRQFDYPVESTDALQILIASFMGPKEQLFQYSELENEYWYNRVPTQVHGVLKNFFRASAKPIVVVVTDDNAEGVDDKNFEKLAQTHLGKVPTVYAFSGDTKKGKSSDCDIYKDGVAYDRVAKKTGGELFDICERDWSKNFSKLTKGISTLLKNTFLTEHPIGKITSIDVNGVRIPESQYSFTGNSITVLSEAFPPNQASKVIVNYFRED
jgi:hypothetical protein